MSGLASVAGVVEVARFGAGPPRLLLEVPHGATRAEHYHDLRRQLRGAFPDDLQDFFFVNTDAGAPELATAIATEVAQRGGSVLVLQCSIPRTFIDCNRIIDLAAADYKAGGVTPGIPPYIRDPDDQALLRARYAAYREVAEAAYAQVCGQGGQAWMVHTYAPRSVDVAVDDDIVRQLHRAYLPDVYPTWPLRPEVDLITKLPDGARIADDGLVERLLAALRAAHIEATEGGTYPVHPSTLAYQFATHYPKQTLCLEVRRDLLADPFTPFAEMNISAAKTARLAEVMVGVLR